MKKQIWILYETIDYERNRSFVNMLCEEIERQSDAYEGKLILAEYLFWGIVEQKQKLWYQGEEIEQPELVIARTRDYRLSRSLERMGIRVCNSSYVCEVCNDKAMTYQIVAQLGIPTPETYIGEAGLDRLAYPYVIKSVDGHGGTEVFLVHDHNERDEVLRQLQGHAFVGQRLVSELGVDVRVYVCGGRIIQAMKRQSKSDFRSNFCLGGEASCYEPDAKMVDYVQRLQEHFQFDYAGIDFIFDHEEPILNEIEDAVGARMLYTYTEIDIVKEYITYLFSQLSE